MSKHHKTQKHQTKQQQQNPQMKLIPSPGTPYGSYTCPDESARPMPFLLSWDQARALLEFSHCEAPDAQSSFGWSGLEMEQNGRMFV